MYVVYVFFYRDEPLVHHYPSRGQQGGGGGGGSKTWQSVGCIVVIVLLLIVIALAVIIPLVILDDDDDSGESRWTNGALWALRPWGKVMNSGGAVVERSKGAGQESVTTFVFTDKLFGFGMNPE